MQLIDSHCHLTAPELADKLEDHISNAQKAGVTGFILPGVTQKDWADQLRLAKSCKGIYPAAGLHPLFLDSHLPHHLNQLKALCEGEQVVAIGEIGIDFHEGRKEASRQTELFHNQLLIARSAKLPVILHVRKAHDEVLAVLRKTRFSCGGTVHAFNGSLQQASHYRDLGFCMGIGGTISYNRAQKRRKIAAELPLDTIVLETDAPYMQLAGRKDHPNSPKYLRDILDILAELRDEPLEVLAHQSRENTTRIFQLSNWDTAAG